MITDLILDEFLTSIGDTPTSNLDLRIAAKESTDVNDWRLYFNRLSLEQMYHEYKFVVNQLMYANIDDTKRLALFDQVNQVVSILVGKLRHSYQTQPGFLDQDKQRALDTVLSIHYLGIMFYHVVWQRAANKPVTAPKKPFASLLQGKCTQRSPTQVIEHCLYGTMLLLRQSLFEKYMGYRQDTRVIWQYLNACYRFATLQSWQSLWLPLKISYVPEFDQPQGEWTLTNLYYHCLAMALTNPYACRRPDILSLQKTSATWFNQLIISQDLLEKPYVYIDLESDEPPQVLAINSAYNPFSATSHCLFIMFSRIKTYLLAYAAKAQDSQDIVQKNYARQANLVHHNINMLLQPRQDSYDRTGACDIVLGFQHIHYLLANKMSLNKLIGSEMLPERLRPRLQKIDTDKQQAVMTVEGENAQEIRLTQFFSYGSEGSEHTIDKPHPDNQHIIRQLQVNSLIAIKKHSPEPIWQLGYLKDMHQQLLPTAPRDAVTNRHLQLHFTIDIHSQNVVPCGVRLQSPNSRPAYFLPAFILPKDGAQPTRLVMMRLGYHLDERLVIRIGNNEINVRLCKRLTITDSIEEYAFVKLV